MSRIQEQRVRAYYEGDVIPYGQVGKIEVSFVREEVSGKISSLQLTFKRYHPRLCKPNWYIVTFRKVGYSLVMVRKTNEHGDPAWLPNRIYGKMLEVGRLVVGKVRKTIELHQPGGQDEPVGKIQAAVGLARGCQLRLEL